MARPKLRVTEPPQPPARGVKAATWSLLLDTGMRLIQELGHIPSVAEVAVRAKVSRATAYRYFPTQEAMLVEVAQVNPAAEPVERWLASLEGGEPAERLQGLLTAFNGVVVTEEVALRTGLRVYLDTWLESRRHDAAPAAVREGRRTRWLDEALEPVRQRLRPAQWRRVRSALALTLGVEALVVMKDVCNLSDDEALATLEWAAQALLRAGLDSPAGKAPTRKA